jgi:hypothetical protein
VFDEWKVTFSRTAAKQYEKLKRSGSKNPSIIDTIDLLAIDLASRGPYIENWPNYGPIKKQRYHCHLKKGHPTYVACWEIVDKKEKQIEVYYVGTHEKAPY